MLKRPLLIATLLCALTAQAQEPAACACPSYDTYRVRLYFGLSVPGGGGVSLKEWQDFEAGELAAAFDGFNVEESVGYYKGVPEQSKVVTVVLGEADMPKVRQVAAAYARRFRQESVMVEKTPVAEWDFIGPGGG